MTDQERADLIERLTTRLIDAIEGEEDVAVVGTAYGLALGCDAKASNDRLSLLHCAGATLQGVITGELLD